MYEQLPQNLRRARELILSADARLRYYAYIPEATEDQITQARGDWNAALANLWESLGDGRQLRDEARAGEVLAASTQATDALVVLIEALGRKPAPGSDYLRSSY